MRRLGFSLLIFSALVFYATIQQWQADLLAQYDSGTWAYHLNDGLGSVRGLTDPTGQVVQGYSFSPYGVPLGESGGEPYGFTGVRLAREGFCRAGCPSYWEFSYHDRISLKTKEDRALPRRTIERNAKVCNALLA
jgi:hypothetical protein